MRKRLVRATQSMTPSDTLSDTLSAIYTSRLQSLERPHSLSLVVTAIMPILRRRIVTIRSLAFVVWSHNLLVVASVPRSLV